MGNANKSNKKKNNHVNQSVVEKQNMIKNYFTLIDQNMLKFYHENQINQINLSISFDKKDFKNSILRRNFQHTGEKFIYWKTYLLKHLTKNANKGFSWAFQMKNYINNEVFITENKYLSAFFWQEFEIRLKPECLVNLNNKKSQTSKLMSSNFSNKINLSVSENDEQQTYQNGDATKIYKEHRKRVKSYVNIFKEHLFDEEHPLNMVCMKFIQYFCEFMKEKIKEIEQQDFSINGHVYESSMRKGSDRTINQNQLNGEIMTKQLQKFILKVQTAIRLFYCKTINYSDFIEERDELINLVTLLIFKNGEIHESLSNLYKITLSKHLINLKTKLQAFQHLKPQELGIHHKFCLNETTLEYQTLMLGSNKVKNTGKNEIKEKTEESRFEEMQIKKKKLTDIIKNINNRMLLKEKFNPFENALKKLEKLTNCYIPLDKMVIIASISNEITSSVNEFWKGLEIFFKTNSILNIDADELMSIFIYIIIKSQMYDLLVHMKIIKEFTTSVSRSTMMGYYFVTLEASVMYIVESDEETISRDLTEKERNRKSSFRVKLNSN